MSARKVAIVTGSATGVGEAIVWLADGARTTTGELVLLDSGMHLGTAMRAVVPPRS